MARPTLVLDASVGVKWFSARDEASLPQALAIRNAHVAGDTRIVVPDLFYYEVANALVYQKPIPTEAIQLAVEDLFALGLKTVPTGADLMAVSIKIARQFNITVYDACYTALAEENHCPLVTANPRHQQQALSCQVILLEEWR